MLKNIILITKAAVCCATIIICSYASAEVVHIPVEIPCSENPMVAPWITYNGEPKIQYAITTEGLRETEKEGVLEVINVNGLGRTHEGIHTYVEARCMPADVETDVSLTNSSLICKKGEGIKIKMFEPNSINPGQYRYVGILTIMTENKKKIMEVESKSVAEISSQSKQLQFNVESTFSKAAASFLSQ